jgi:glycosyltransferase involved in cell wall biosynthesis
VRVYVYPADLGGCGYYRMIWPAQRLIDLGYDVKLVMPKDRNDPSQSLSAEVDQKTGEIVSVTVPEDADVMVFQRVTHQYLARAIPTVRAGGVAVVVEIDDDLSSLDPSNPAFSAMHPKRVDAGFGEHSWLNTRLAADSATLVVTSTAKLVERYGRHGRVEVLHNLVPRSYLDIEHVDSKEFGWAGGLYSHKPDISQVGYSVRQLIEDGYTFTHIGGPEGVKAELGLTDRHLIRQPGDTPLDLYPHRLTELGVGLAPLRDNLFNASKSWLKPLEYAAVGVVPVMSPRAEYQRIFQRGIGQLAKNPRQFYQRTRQLLDDPIMRHDMSQAGREIVAEMTYEDHATRWWDAWSRAYEIQQSS